MHVTSTTSDTDRALPEVAGTWESDEEPLSVLYRYREIPGSTVHLMITPMQRVSSVGTLQMKFGTF